MKKYEVILNKEDKDKIILETDDFDEAVNCTKTIAHQYKMKASKTSIPNLLMLYIKMENSRIVYAVGLIENRN